MKTKKIFTLMLVAVMVVVPTVELMRAKTVHAAVTSNDNDRMMSNGSSGTNSSNGMMHNWSNGSSESNHMMQNGSDKDDHNNMHRGFGGYDNDNHNNMHRGFGGYDNDNHNSNINPYYPLINSGIVCIPRSQWGSGFFNQYGTRCVPTTVTPYGYGSSYTPYGYGNSFNPYGYGNSFNPYGYGNSFSTYF